MDEMIQKYVEEIVRAQRLQDGLEAPFTVTKWVIAADVESVDDVRNVQVFAGEQTSPWDMYGLARVIEMDAANDHEIT